jgi:hypothetical protein
MELMQALRVAADILVLGEAGVAVEETHTEVLRGGHPCPKK